MVAMAQGRIPQADIEAIRERTPIEEVVGEYVQLKPAGVDSLKGLSPFKDEKTPRFMSVRIKDISTVFLWRGR